MKLKSIWCAAAALVLTVTGCSLLSMQSSSDSVFDTDNLPPHARKMQTLAYSGNRGAVIFVLNHLEDSSLIAVTDRILRVFAENGVPVDVAVQTDSLAKHGDILKFLIDYVDAGIIDISVSGAEVNWVDVDSPNIQNAVDEVKAQLVSARTCIGRYFGVQTYACVFPYESLNEHNYSCLIDTGFKIMSTRMSEGFSSSRQPVSWNAAVDPGGLIRLPVVGIVNYRGAADLKDADIRVIDAAKKSLERPGIAVIEIDPAYFLAENNQIDSAMIQQLGRLIKSAKSLGEVVTFDGWNRYAAEYITVAPAKRIMPVYNGGTAIIFRLDDVCKGWHEEVDRQLINIFRDNGVPLDCGVISSADGTDSYDIPWLKDYLDNGIIGISVHGYDWTYYQLDTSKSNLTYDFIKCKLIRARDDYMKYFGLSPVAITVPTDYFDETGYKAIQDAGFKVFSTQFLIERHPSTRPVDYYGRTNKDGLYRIPTASDVCQWDDGSQRFTNVIDISKISDVEDVCNKYTTDTTLAPCRAFSCSICSVLNSIDVTAVGIHPSAFVDENGKPDDERLQKLDAIVKWAKNIGTITTFEQWYNYTSNKQ
ncbi:MAG: DUF2334 domain-containing protein [Dehalococcoidia bacterium]|nr:DUF2334 domain-containing protein [Dehalococcoidia bacterium]